MTAAEDVAVSDEFEAFRRDLDVVRRGQYTHELPQDTVEILNLFRGRADALFSRVSNLEHERRMYKDMASSLKGDVKVLCRVRPDRLPEFNDSNFKNVRVVSMKELEVNMLSTKQFRRRRSFSVRTSKSVSAIEDQWNKTDIANSDPKMFYFDHCFGPEAQDDEVSSAVCEDILAGIKGHQVCIMAYGATGAGKTHTIEAISRRACTMIEEEARKIKSRREILSVRVQVVEVYNETFRDLLDPSTPPNSLKLTSNQYDGTSIQLVGTRIWDVPPTNIRDGLLDLFYLAKTNRATAVTNVHERSSRSHLVANIMLTHSTTNGHILSAGKVSLVDLAGSERTKNSEATGQRMKEAQHINKSLAALGDVVWAQARKTSHVPYRNSKLTHLLQDSLGGSMSRTVLIIAAAQCPQTMPETLHAIEFGSRLNNVSLNNCKRLADSVEHTRLRSLVEQGSQHQGKLEEKVWTLTDETNALRNEKEAQAKEKLELAQDHRDLVRRLKNKDEELMSALRSVQPLEDKLKKQQNDLKDKDSILEKSKRDCHKLRDENQVLKVKVRDLENRLKKEVGDHYDNYQSHTPIRQTSNGGSRQGCTTPGGNGASGRQENSQKSIYSSNASIAEKARPKSSRLSWSGPASAEKDGASTYRNGTPLVIERRSQAGSPVKGPAARGVMQTRPNQAPNKSPEVPRPSSVPTAPQQRNNPVDVSHTPSEQQSQHQSVQRPPSTVATSLMGSAVHVTDPLQGTRRYHEMNSILGKTAPPTFVPKTTPLIAPPSEVQRDRSLEKWDPVRINGAMSVPTKATYFTMTHSVHNQGTSPRSSTHTPCSTNESSSNRITFDPDGRAPSSKIGSAVQVPSSSSCKQTPVSSTQTSRSQSRNRITFDPTERTTQPAVHFGTNTMPFPTSRATFNCTGLTGGNISGVQGLGSVARSVSAGVCLGPAPMLQVNVNPVFSPMNPTSVEHRVQERKINMSPVEQRHTDNVSVERSVEREFQRESFFSQNNSVPPYGKKRGHTDRKTFFVNPITSQEAVATLGLDRCQSNESDPRKHDVNSLSTASGSNSKEFNPDESPLLYIHRLVQEEEVCDDVLSCSMISNSSNGSEIKKRLRTALIPGKQETWQHHPHMAGPIIGGRTANAGLAVPRLINPLVPFSTVRRRTGPGPVF